MDPFGTIPSPPWRAWPVWLLFSVKMTQPHPLLPINPTRFARDFRCVPCHLPDSPAPLYCHSSRPCRALGAPRSPLHGGAYQALSSGQISMFVDLVSKVVTTFSISIKALQDDLGAGGHKRTSRCPTPTPGVVHVPPKPWSTSSLKFAYQRCVVIQVSYVNPSIDRLPPQLQARWMGGRLLSPQHGY